VGSWDFPSEQSFRSRNRYDYKPRTLFCWWEKLTAALCGRNNRSLRNVWRIQPSCRRTERKIA